MRLFLFDVAAPATSANRHRLRCPRRRESPDAVLAGAKAASPPTRSEIYACRWSPRSRGGDRGQSRTAARLTRGASRLPGETPERETCSNGRFDRRRAAAGEARVLGDTQRYLKVSERNLIRLRHVSAARLQIEQARSARAARAGRCCRQAMAGASAEKDPRRSQSGMHPRSVERQGGARRRQTSGDNCSRSNSRGASWCARRARRAGNTASDAAFASLSHPFGALQKCLRSATKTPATVRHGSIIGQPHDPDAEGRPSSKEKPLTRG